MTSRAVKPGSRRCAVQGGAWERRNWEWQRKPKPSIVTAGSRMVPSTSASRRRLKAATSRFWAVTSTAQAQQSRGSRGSGPPPAAGRCAPGTSAMACLAPARPGRGPYSPLSCPSPGPASPHPPLSWNAAPGLGTPQPEERTSALDIPQAPRGGARPAGVCAAGPRSPPPRARPASSSTLSKPGVFL